MATLKIALATLVVVALSSAAKAGSLGLTANPPVLFSSFLDVTYTVSGTTGTFTVEGQPSGFQPSASSAVDSITDAAGDTPAAITDYLITMSLDTTTDQPTSGSLTVGGSVLALGANAPLLTGNLTDFGFNDAGTTFEFLFTPTGGSLESYFPNSIGAIVHPNYIPGSGPTTTGAAIFNSDFNNGDPVNGQMGDSDTFATSVPLPAVFPMGMLLLGFVAANSLRKSWLVGK